MWGAVLSVVNINQGGTRRTGNIYISPPALEQLSGLQVEQEVLEGERVFWSGVSC